MQAQIIQLHFRDRADYALCAFIRKLREKYGPLDPDVNEDYRKWLIAPGITLRQERGCVICMKPAVGMVQTDGAWSCSDYEPIRKKVRRK